MAYAVMMSRANVMAAGADWITVVFTCRAHVDFVLTELAFEAFAYSSAWIRDVHTFALPRIYMIVADGLVATGRAQTLINVQVTISRLQGRTLTHAALCSVL